MFVVNDFDKKFNLLEGDLSNLETELDREGNKDVDTAEKKINAIYFIFFQLTSQYFQNPLLSGIEDRFSNVRARAQVVSRKINALKV